MFKHRRLLSQNFLHNGQLVRDLVRRSSIGKNDLVIEIGPGDGIILNELVKHAGKVIGIEIDYELFEHLKRKYLNTLNLNLYLGNALSFPVPRTPYKIFSNIPFAIEGNLIRKFLEESNPPLDCFLIVRKDLAVRLLRKNTLFNISNAPFFEFSIFHYFNRHDFKPTPKVEAAMLRFRLKDKPLLHFEERKRYQEFVKEGYGNGLPIYQNLKHRYGKTSLSILNKLGVPKNVRPSSVNLELWIRLYKFLQTSQSRRT